MEQNTVIGEINIDELKEKIKEIKENKNKKSEGELLQDMLDVTMKIVSLKV